VRYSRDLYMFNIYSSSKYCPSVRCASAAEVVYRDVFIFGTKTVSLNHVLNMFSLIITYKILIYMYIYIYIFSSRRGWHDCSI
jgi:hypothetical protein